MITTPSTTTRALPMRETRKDRNFMLRVLRGRARTSVARPGAASEPGLAALAAGGAYFSM
ncbi:hypothetical protein MyNCGM683_21750 [Achromobacter xylosoxidans]